MYKLWYKLGSGPLILKTIIGNWIWGRHLQKFMAGMHAAAVLISFVVNSRGPTGKKIVMASLAAYIILYFNSSTCHRCAHVQSIPVKCTSHTIFRGDKCKQPLGGDCECFLGVCFGVSPTVDPLQTRVQFKATYPCHVSGVLATTASGHIVQWTAPLTPSLSSTEIDNWDLRHFLIINSLQKNNYVVWGFLSCICMHAMHTLCLSSRRSLPYTNPFSIFNKMKIDSYLLLVRGQFLLWGLSK